MLTQLEEDGWILTANHNSVKYDRTKWYALSDNTIGQGWNFHLTDVTNRSDGSVQPIPYKNHIKTNTTPTPSQSSGAESAEVEEKESSIPKPKAPAKKSTGSARFKPPTVEDVSAYVAERVAKGKPRVDAETFVDFYESKGWMIGKSKMKSWQAAVRTWERSRKDQGGGQQASGTGGLMI